MIEEINDSRQQVTKTKKTAKKLSMKKYASQISLCSNVSTKFDMQHRLTYADYTNLEWSDEDCLDIVVP